MGSIHVITTSTGELLQHSAFFRSDEECARYIEDRVWNQPEHAPAEVSADKDVDLDSTDLWVVVDSRSGRLIRQAGASATLEAWLEEQQGEPAARTARNQRNGEQDRRPIMVSRAGAARTPKPGALRLAPVTVLRTEGADGRTYEAEWTPTNDGRRLHVTVSERFGGAEGPRTLYGVGSSPLIRSIDEAEEVIDIHERRAAAGRAGS